VVEICPNEWSTVLDGGGLVVSAVKTSALEAFAVQLKAWRKKHGWSQGDLADKLAYSDLLVSGIETMAKTPTLDFARRCDEVFDAPGTFVLLHGLLSREAWPSYFAPVIDFENQAVRIHEWELRVVPGLLQTEDYARSVITAGKPRLGGAELDRKVNARIERQRLFERDNPPMYWTVLSEGALRQVIGSPSIMGGNSTRSLRQPECPASWSRCFPSRRATIRAPTAPSRSSTSSTPHRPPTQNARAAA
jgi:transcriptional regulator with XRE-family HTH domain